MHASRRYFRFHCLCHLRAEDGEGVWWLDRQRQLCQLCHRPRMHRVPERLARACLAIKDRQAARLEHVAHLLLLVLCEANCLGLVTLGLRCVAFGLFGVAFQLPLVLAHAALGLEVLFARLALLLAEIFDALLMPDDLPAFLLLFPMLLVP